MKYDTARLQYLFLTSKCFDYAQQKRLKVVRLPHSRRSEYGFTLIELLIVISIIGILTTLSIAAYSSFNNTQKFNNTTNNFINMLQVAKSRASSQYIPSQYCGSATTLENYAVVLTSTDFGLYVTCGGTLHLMNNKEKISGATFSPSSGSYTFKVLQDTPASGGIIIITGPGRTKTVQIDDVTGRITVTES